MIASFHEGIYRHLIYSMQGLSYVAHTQILQTPGKVVMNTILSPEIIVAASVQYNGRWI